MKAQRVLIFLALLTTGWSCAAKSIAEHFPLKEYVKGTTFGVADNLLTIRQNGDVTTIQNKDGDVLEKVDAPRFLSAVIESTDKKSVLFVVSLCRDSSSYDYAALLRFKLGKDDLWTAARLLKKEDQPLNQRMHFIAKLDSMLNDGSTVRLYYGRPERADDPMMKMRYRWQIWDIEKAEMLKEEPEEQKEDS